MAVARTVGIAGATDRGPSPRPSPSRGPAEWVVKDCVIVIFPPANACPADVKFFPNWLNYELRLPILWDVCGRATQSESVHIVLLQGEF